MDDTRRDDEGRKYGPAGEKEGWPVSRNPEDRTDDDAWDLAELPRDIADRAIARYNEAVRESAEAYRLAGDHPEYENWTDFTTAAEIASRELLIKAILAYDPEYSGPRRYRAERRRWEPRGVRSNGRLYITAPNPDRDEGIGGIAENIDGPILMQLFVIEESRIVDVERAGYIDREVSR